MKRGEIFEHASNGQVTSQGSIFYVDDEDWDRVSQYTWMLTEDCYPFAWVVIEDGRRIKTPMHRFILKTVPPDKVIHHRNKCKNDNRKSNLMILTQSEHSKAHIMDLKGEKDNPYIDRDYPEEKDKDFMICGQLLPGWYFAELLKRTLGN